MYADTRHGCGVENTYYIMYTAQILSRHLNYTLYAFVLHTVCAGVVYR